MFDMMGAVAPVDKHSLEVICAIQLLRMEAKSEEDALRVLGRAEREKIIGSDGGARNEAALREHDELFARKHADLTRKSKAKERKIYIAASGKYAKIVLAKR